MLSSTQEQSNAEANGFGCSWPHPLVAQLRVFEAEANARCEGSNYAVPVHRPLRYHHLWPGEKVGDKAVHSQVSEDVQLSARHAMPYDSFISYRREQGSELARLVFEGLKGRGVRCFLDVDGLRGGRFDDALLRHIEATPNFIIILTPRSLDRRAG